MESDEHTEPRDDARHGHDGHGRHEAKTTHHRLASALIGALLALLGFALAIQLRTAGEDDSLEGARQDDLIRILEDQDNQEERLRQQIEDLQSASERLQSGGDPTAAAAEASERANDLGVLTGTLPAVGPGVQITLSDPLGDFHAEDMLDLVAELRGAGAEAIQIGPVRIGVSSSFVDAPDGAILADGQRLTRPFLIIAIGDPKTLDTALNIPGGVAASVKEGGGQLIVTRAPRVEVTAVRTPPVPQYASPAPS